LRGDFDSSDRGIFRYVTNLIDLDAGFTGERGLQLLCERSWLGIAAGKCANEAGELRLRQSRREMNAGNSRTGQQLREAFFAGGRAERHAVQQNLVAGSAKQEAASDALIKRTSEFFPRGFKLRRGSHVAKFIEPRELQ
jgi:hypothetical protein